MTLERLLAAADDTVDELLALWQRIVQFETVNAGVAPTGHETPCAEFIREQLATDGIAGEVWEAAPGRGNLLACLPGTGGGRSLLWMSHLDVVPPGDVARWTAPPFAGQVFDGWLLGRGSNDCKGLAAAEVHALRLLARHGVKLAGDIKLACCADEETGGAFGFGAVAAQRPEALQADLAINEGGGSPTWLPDGRPGYYVANGEKGRFEAHLRIVGRSEHASLPWLADSPMPRVAEVLARLRDYQPEVHLTQPVQQLLTAVCGRGANDLADLETMLSDQLGERAGDAARLRGLSRMTITPTMLQAGVKSNAIPDEATIVCDIRALPSQSPAYAASELHNLLGDIPGVNIEVVPTALANETAWTPELAQVLQRGLNAMGEPQATLIPTLCTGFTDARLVRPLGTPVLGFAPLPHGTDLTRCGCHNVDEQFPLAAVLQRTRFLLALAWTYAGSYAVST